MKALPLARQASLIVKEVDDETLIYDLEADQAHCLNNTAARVWKSCDGETSVAEMALNLRSNGDAPVDESIVWLALDQLEKFKLLEQPVDTPRTFVSGMTRRQAVRALGVAAITLPAITSLIVPTAALAQSLLPLGFCCNNPNQCGSSCCAQRPIACICPPVGIGPPCTPSTSGKQCAATNPVGPVCQDI